MFYETTHYRIGYRYFIIIIIDVYTFFTFLFFITTANVIAVKGELHFLSIRISSDETHRRRDRYSTITTGRTRIRSRHNIGRVGTVCFVTYFRVYDSVRVYLLLSHLSIYVNPFIIYVLKNKRGLCR